MWSQRHTHSGIFFYKFIFGVLTRIASLAQNNSTLQSFFISFSCVFIVLKCNLLLESFFFFQILWVKNCSDRVLIQITCTVSVYYYYYYCLCLFGVHLCNIRWCFVSNSIKIELFPSVPDIVGFPKKHNYYLVCLHRLLSSHITLSSAKLRKNTI